MHKGVNTSNVGVQLVASLSQIVREAQQLLQEGKQGKAKQMLQTMSLQLPRMVCCELLLLLCHVCKLSAHC